VAYGAYVCYLLSQYVVLLLNRTREYFADHYAAVRNERTVDIIFGAGKDAYRMVRERRRIPAVMAMGSKDDRRMRADATAAGTVALMEFPMAMVRRWRAGAGQSDGSGAG